MQTIPPLPTYSDNLPTNSSTIPRNVRHPQLTMHWESFQRDTLNYIQTEVTELTIRVNMPEFPFEMTITSEVPELQMGVAPNLFNVVERMFLILRDSWI